MLKMFQPVVNLLTRRIINCSFSTCGTLFSSLLQFNATHFLFRAAEIFTEQHNKFSYHFASFQNNTVLYSFRLSHITGFSGFLTFCVYLPYMQFKISRVFSRSATFLRLFVYFCRCCCCFSYAQPCIFFSLKIHRKFQIGCVYLNFLVNYLTHLLY